MHYPCNLGTFQYSSPYGGGIFRPQGHLHATDDAGLFGQLARTSWTSRDTISARIIVGFNVGKRPTWTINDLMAIVREVRTAQTGNPNASFLSQKGIYQHQDPRQGVVVEDGAQVIIIDMQQLPIAKFEEQMIQLAEEIARRFHQEEVIVEIQRNGIMQRVHGVAP